MTVRITPGGKVTFQRNTKTTIRPPISTMSAVGGQSVQDIVVSGLTYRVHTFTSSGILTVTSGPTGAATVEYLIVGGGGGGGNQTGYQQACGPGGGAGGFISGSYTFTSNGPYTVTVGSGGAATSKGTDSIIASPINPAILIAYGGGSAASNGGSGSGGYWSGGGGGFSLFGQGNPGGPGGTVAQGDGTGNYIVRSGGGGGGAGGAASPITPTSGGDGGAAKETFIRGTPEWFAAGGGGGGYGNGGIGGGRYLGGTGEFSSNPSPTGIPKNAIAQTGSGGGGAANQNTPGGGNGSAGIVIIRYRIA
jgi:hypothetical protein